MAMNADLQTRLAACEETNRRLERLLRLQLTAGVLLVALLVIGCVTAGTSKAPPSATPATLRLSEVVIVDAKGVERARLSGDLPDAVINGKRIPRGEKAAGLILYDATGQERGGYVTWDPSGTIGLTLDTRTRQVAYFVADPDSGSALRMWNGKDEISLRSDDEGSRLTAVQADKVVVQQPAVSMGAEGCSAYREAKTKMPAEQVWRECARRYTDAVCRSCLGER
jgi:hypothetical protein